jgi:hypothetical protein
MTAIKKLPPGEAIGADDLRNWAWRRNVGRSGTPMNRKEWKQWGMPKAKDTADRWLAKYDRKKP